jgi:hypothetical protein
VENCSISQRAKILIDRFLGDSASEKGKHTEFFNGYVRVCIYFGLYFASATPVVFGIY